MRDPLIVEFKVRQRIIGLDIIKNINALLGNSIAWFVVMRIMEIPQKTHKCAGNV